LEVSTLELCSSFHALVEILFSVYWFFFAVQLSIVQLWQDEFHWSALSASVHAIPFGKPTSQFRTIRSLTSRVTPSGASAAISSFLTGRVAHRVPRKVLLIFGQLLMLGAAILLVYGARSPDGYWPYCFPAMVLGLAGVAMTYTTSTIAIMEGARPGEHGVVSGVMYTAYQVGATIGIAITTAVATGMSDSLGPNAQPDIRGYQASFWSLVVMHGIVIIIVLCFVH
jgi:MFS family permease